MKYRPCGYLKIIVILQPFKYYYLCDGNITQMCLLIKSRIEMRKNLFYYLFTVLCTATLFISCSDDEDTPNPVNPLVGVYSLSDYETADFVVAEGDDPIKFSEGRSFVCKMGCKERRSVYSSSKWNVSYDGGDYASSGVEYD